MTAFRAAAEHVAKEAHAYGVRHGVLRKAEGASVAPLWVGFWLTPEAAAALAIPNGESPGELHVTLCYVPEASATQAQAAVAALAVRAQGAHPFTGQVTGAGRFDGGEESDAQDVLYAVPDMAGLAAFREELVQALSAVGAVPSREHEFTPHIALKYVPPTSDETVDPAPVPLAFDTLEVRHDKRTLALLPLGAPATAILAKAEGDPDAFDEQQAATFLAGLDFAGLLALRDDFAEVLSDLALGGARQGMTTVRMLVPDAEDFALPSDGVQAWAADRAAWLVGKRVLEDGSVIDNPNAAYAIDETTRKALRGTIAQAFTPNADGEYQTFAELRDSIAQSYAFSEQRAALIARHEVGNALMQGNIETWKASGVVTSARWILSDLHDKPDECDDYAGQLFPIDEIPELPHPACECDVIPEVEEEV